MKKTMRFSTFINAPRDRVWQLMLAPDSYRKWTAAFMEGSTYEGSWEQGQRIRFVGPAGDGMVAEVAENRRGEFVSLKHLGEVRKDGTEDLDSPAVKAWAPAHENYRFLDRDGGTEVQVEMDVLPAYEEFMQQAWPKALAALKDVCEQRVSA
ncbi:MAG TPA: SRPBCC domain-containing protein [Ramlibacter sp.]|nr:SRPBCC domain-containing protein [Ramlibacter sp.]